MIACWTHDDLDRGRPSPRRRVTTRVATLLDANVLIALLVADHLHHDAAEAWFAASGDRFATCPVTEGSLTRSAGPTST